MTARAMLADSLGCSRAAKIKETKMTQLNTSVNYGKSFIVYISDALLNHCIT